jgi:DNA-binding XRE family transcriptional regulator
VAAQDRTPDADARALLGELLRQARIEGGHPTQADLAGLLGIDRTGVTRTETGGALPNWEVMREWLIQCGVSGLAEAAIIGIWKLGKTWGEPSRAKTAPWFSAEAVAHTLRYWSPTVIPGLFQTAPYARTLFEIMGHDGARINEDVDDRIKRQAILTRANPPTVICVLDESVLHKFIGSPEIMREQCQHLLDVSQSVVVQIVPNDIGGHAGLGGSISLAATDDAPELLLSDGLVEDHVTAEPALVHRVSATFERVRAEALPRSASRRVITEAMERWSR